MTKKNKREDVAAEDTMHPRPWGFYEILVNSSDYKVKRIYIHAGHRLSLQRHTYRSEHWTIVQGTAFVTIDGVSSHREPGTHIHVPLGAVHRIGAPLGGVTFIEVQTGPYLGEDDIERLEDDYSRADNAPGRIHIDEPDAEVVRRLRRNLFQNEDASKCPGQCACEPESKQAIQETVAPRDLSTHSGVAPEDVAMLHASNIITLSEARAAIGLLPINHKSQDTVLISELLGS